MQQSLPHKGFSLLEMVVVMVIATILGVIMVTLYSDRSEQSYQQTLDSVAGALGTAAAHNYRLARAGDPDAVNIDNCNDVPDLLPDSSPLPNGYTVSARSISAGSEVSCTITAPNGSTTATFQAIAPN